VSKGVHVARGERLERVFYERATLRVARALLGQRLVSLCGGVRVAGEIVETEAYPPGDSTNHASRGRTARNASMFGVGGLVYVYFTYGMHHCLNLVTESEPVGTAVLIRAVAPAEGLAAIRERRGPRASVRDLCRGPGRLCTAFGVDRSVDGVDSCAPEAVVFVERGRVLADADVQKGPRVGVVGRAEDVRAPRRFWLAGSLLVSDGPRLSARHSTRGAGTSARR
jgi:DNA-3-methyladenine glycosylase